VTQRERHIIDRGTWAIMVGQLLAQAVRDAGSARKAASVLGVPRSTISAWVRRHRAQGTWPAEAAPVSTALPEPTQAPEAEHLRTQIDVSNSTAPVGVEPTAPRGGDQPSQPRWASDCPRLGEGTTEQPDRLELARAVLDEANGGRPDFAGFAQGLRVEADWHETSVETARELRRLADEVERVGREIDLWMVEHGAGGINEDRVNDRPVLDEGATRS
jgi:hypothetical protein